MIEAATLTEGSRVSSVCRNQAWNYDEVFIEALGKLTEGQRKWLKVFDGVSFVSKLVELIPEFDAHCKWEKMPEALAMID